MGGKPGKYGFDPETGYPLCKRGHVRSPDNITGNKGCKECYRLANKARKQTVKYKTKMAEYYRTEKYKTQQKVRRQTEEYKIRVRAYQKTEKYKDRMRELRQSEGYKAWRNMYMHSGKGRESTRLTNRRNVDDLSDSYVSGILGIPVALATPELIEIKRLTIQLGRTLKCQNQQNP